VLIHAHESEVKQHPSYKAAKAGDGVSATTLVNVVAHTGANGFSRLARQAEFDGVIQAQPTVSARCTALL
jgi:hypothetical protein